MDSMRHSPGRLGAAAALALATAACNVSDYRNDPDTDCVPCQQVDGGQPDAGDAGQPPEDTGAEVDQQQPPPPAAEDFCTEREIAEGEEGPTKQVFFSDNKGRGWRVRQADTDGDGMLTGDFTENAAVGGFEASQNIATLEDINDVKSKVGGGYNTLYNPGGAGEVALWTQSREKGSTANETQAWATEVYSVSPDRVAQLRDNDPKVQDDKVQAFLAEVNRAFNENNQGKLSSLGLTLKKTTSDTDPNDMYNEAVGEDEWILTHVPYPDCEEGLETSFVETTRDHLGNVFENAFAMGTLSPEDEESEIQEVA